MPNPFQETNPQETQELSDFGNQFLNGVEESDREIVSKYIKQWDGNVTRKFQEYSGKLKDYEELGDPSSLMAARELIDSIQNDPVGFFHYYRDYLQENADVLEIENLEEALGIKMQQEMEQQGNGTNLPEFEGLPPEFVNQFTQMKEFIESMGTEFKEMKADRETQEQMAMLDNVLENLHNEHGDFDERVVLAYIATGMSPEDSIQAYNELSESIVNSQGKPAPQLLSGPAQVPLDQVDMTKLKDPAVRKQIGAQLLSGLQP